MLALLLGVDLVVDELVLEGLDLVVPVVEMNTFSAKLALQLFVVRVVDGPLQQQTQGGGLGDVDSGLFKRLRNELLGVGVASYTESNHGDHLSDLVQHEGLAVDLDTDPLGSVDQKGITTGQRLHGSHGRGVLERLAQSEVVEVVGALVDFENLSDLSESFARDSELLPVSSLDSLDFLKSGSVSLGVSLDLGLGHLLGFTLLGFLPLDLINTGSLHPLVVRDALGLEIGSDRLPVLLALLVGAGSILEELLGHDSARSRVQERVGRHQVLVDSRRTQLSALKSLVGSRNAPDTQLLGQMAVDLLHNVLVLNDHLQRDDVTGGMHTLIGSSSSHESRLFGVVGVVLRDGSGLDKGLEDITLNGLLGRIQLHAMVTSSTISNHTGNLSLGLSHLVGHQRTVRLSTCISALALLLLLSLSVASSVHLLLLGLVIASRSVPVASLASLLAEIVLLSRVAGRTVADDGGGGRFAHGDGEKSAFQRNQTFDHLQKITFHAVEYFSLRNANYKYNKLFWITINPTAKPALQKQELRGEPVSGSSGFICSF